MLPFSSRTSAIEATGSVRFGEAGRQVAPFEDPEGQWLEVRQLLVHPVEQEVLQGLVRDRRRHGETKPHEGRNDDDESRTKCHRWSRGRRRE